MERGAPSPAWMTIGKVMRGLKEMADGGGVML